jgi:hypothetical protein
MKRHSRKRAEDRVARQEISASTSAPSHRTAWRSAGVAAAFALAALVVALLLPAQSLLSAPDTDLVGQFVASRAFAAQTLATGHIPLWNPYTYAGQPFLGGFESAVLYPPNFIFLCLPLTVALNFSLLLHLVILGWGMERWAFSRGLHPWAAALAGVIMPLSGAVFPHLYAGHLSNLCTMAWAPWIFLGLESWVTRSDRRGLFLASAAICLQILAGHVQYFFYTAIAVTLQAMIVSFAQLASRWRALPAVLGCYLVGMLMGAAQLLPGLAASTEGIRQKKLDYDFAAMFGFPPENFLTLIAPGFFGSLSAPVYWGRCYLWEMTLFIGVASLPLIALACCDSLRRRQACLDLAVAVPLLILALGVHTPLFDLLYGWVPGFGHFRAWSKFIFPATLFLVLTVAAGADYLLREKRSFPRIGWVSLAAGAAAGLAGLFLLSSPDGIGDALGAVAATHESYLKPEIVAQQEFINQAGTHAGLSLGLGGLVFVATGAALIFSRKFLFLRPAILALIVVEMIGFAAGQLQLSSMTDVMPDNLRQFVSAHPGDYRVLDLVQPNNGFLLGAGDLSGNNPTVLRRYAEFMSFVQGADPAHANQYLHFKDFDPLYALLRLRYAFVPGAENGRAVESPTPPLARLLLVSEWKMPGDRDAIFAAMRGPGFDPAKTILLESQPEPLPQIGAVGTARLVSESPDELIIDADTDRPALLLITDLYARDWKAEALPGSAQQTYALMPADYILRAVPLTAGHHHLRVVYAPTIFPLGVGLSLTACLVWLTLLIGMRRKRG